MVKLKNVCKDVCIMLMVAVAEEQSSKNVPTMNWLKIRV